MSYEDPICDNLSWDYNDNSNDGFNILNEKYDGDGKKFAKYPIMRTFYSETPNGAYKIFKDEWGMNDKDAKILANEFASQTEE